MAKGIHNLSVQEAQNLGLGQAGVILIDDTDEHTGPFVAITALEDAAVDITGCDMSFIEDIADFTIPKGATIYGAFASIELDSGKVLAYNSTSKKMEFVSQSGGVDLGAVDEHILPDVDGTRDLASSSYRWRDIYLSSDSIDLAGATISSDGTGAIAIAATGATLPAGSKLGSNEVVVKGTGTASSRVSVMTVPFFSRSGGLSTANATFEFNSTLDNNKPFLDQSTFVLANGSGLTSADTITIFQL